MKKGIILAILGLFGTIGIFVLWGVTPKDQYIWNGGFYVFFIILFLLLTIFGLILILTHYYAKDRYERLRKKYQEKYDASKSIFVNIDELIYYVNKKYLGGDFFVFKCENEFHIIERQVFTDHENQKFSPIYSLDEKVCGRNFNTLLCTPFMDGKALIEFDRIEIIYVNHDYPKALKIKRDFDQVKPHTKLMLSSILLLLFGVIFLCLSFAVSDWYNALIVGGLSTLIGIILMTVFVKKIKDESQVND